MVERIQEFNSGPGILVSRLNEIISAVNILNNMTGDGFIQAKKTVSGVAFSLSLKKVQERMPKVGGDFEATWFQIIEPPSYPDPTATQGTEAHNGRNWYTCRLLGTSISVWEDNHIYYTGDIITWPTVADASYTAKPIHNGVASSEVGGIWPPNLSYWSKNEEIRIEHALGGEVFEDEIAYDVRDCVPWYKAGQLVPVISKIADILIGEKRYFIWQTLQYTGSPYNASLRWNEIQKRTMAVFK